MFFAEMPCTEKIQCIKKEKKKKKTKTPQIGVPAVLPWVKNPTAAAPVNSEVRVPSLIHQGGLKEPVLLYLPIGHSCCLDSIPGLGTSICHGWGHKKISKNKKQDGIFIEGKGNHCILLNPSAHNRFPMIACSKSFIQMRHFFQGHMRNCVGWL